MSRKMKLILVMIISLVILMINVSFVKGTTEFANADTAPSVEIPEQNKEILRVKGQTDFDVKTLFNINLGSYNENQLTVAYTLKKGETVIIHDNLMIDFIDGNYTLSILIAGNGVSIGAPVTANVNFVLRSDAPSFMNADTMDEIKTINIQKNQGFIDLRILYRIMGNSFNEDEWIVTYDAKYPGRNIEIFGDFIKSISGVYTITITIKSVNGDFNDVVSVPMTVIVQKSRPQVVFEYETESGKTVINGEHTIYIYAGTQYVNISEYFTVYGNAYVRNEYSYSVIVKKDNGEGGLVNTQVFDGMISPSEGTYYVTVKVNPKIQGAFTPVVSETVTFYVKKAVPKVNEREIVSVFYYENKDRKIDMSNLLSISDSAYSKNEYSVIYSFTKDGKTITSEDGLVKLSNGEWNAVATITSNDGQFDAQVTDFILAVDVPMSTLTLTLLIAIPCILIIAGIITTIIILKKRNK